MPSSNRSEEKKYSGQECLDLETLREIVNGKSWDKLYMVYLRKKGVGTQGMYKKFTNVKLTIRDNFVIMYIIYL